MLATPFYDPEKTYDENYEHGPFGEFADRHIFKRLEEPTVKFLGQKVYLPFGIPAGPLLNNNYCSAAFAKGFDLCVYKTVRTRSYPCHPAPNVVSLDIAGELSLEMVKAGVKAKAQGFIEPISITNSFGVPSKSVEFWQEDMAKAVKVAGKGQVLIGSFQGTKTDGGSASEFVTDFVQAAKLVKETGAKILEANLSCPNEGTGHLVCFDLDTVSAVTEAIKVAIGDTPLVLKLAYFEHKEQLQQLVERVGGLVQGLATINTMPAKIIDENGQQALPGEGRLISGVCGAGVKWAGLEMVRRLYRLRDELGLEFIIIGVGGVTEPADFDLYRSVGSDAVMSATGAMWRPRLAEEIWQAQIKKGTR